MLINKKNYRTIWYNKEKDNVQIIDQNKLPFELEIISLSNLNDVLLAIKEMKESLGADAVKAAVRSHLDE